MILIRHASIPYWRLGIHLYLLELKVTFSKGNLTILPRQLVAYKATFGTQFLSRTICFYYRQLLLMYFGMLPWKQVNEINEMKPYSELNFRCKLIYQLGVEQNSIFNK